jgi:tRNA (cmo5U34)-methyltransferase
MLDQSEISLRLLSQKDQLFEKGPWPLPFEFNELVANVFDDMVSRSVPLYKEVNASVLQWTHFYYQKNTAIVDLGCSTGTTLELIGRMFESPVKLVGIDASSPMISQADKKLEHLKNVHQVTLTTAPLEDVELPRSSVIILNYTLQFIPFLKRKPILKKIFDALETDGILYISEKVCSSNPAFQETTSAIYENYKLRAGYSKSEVERKKESLDQVLVSMTQRELSDCLTSVGFKNQEIILRWNNFTSMVAQK